MYHAPRADQLALLDVVELDSAIARLNRDNLRHPLREEVGQIMNLIAAVGREIVQAEEDLQASQAALDEASAASERARAVVVEKEQRLNAGTGMDSRQLLTLQSEIETNRAQLEEAENAEYEILEQLEKLESQLADARERHTNLNAELVKQRALLEDDVDDIERQRNDIQIRRDSIYGVLAEPLKRAYEHAVAHGGLTVIALRPDGSTSGGVELSPIEVSQIRQSDPDTFHISDDYGCIVIRDPDFPLT
ncbi:zinc ribbon domain-containing protein [Arcanobacterium pinnipediorum]|uniref:CT398-like coiled coil hairpin domain-containing protein n=1 Tax=Arcanobacterium pinnipediorum TaxID=1503041 RepID=A0ABY5AJH5_9ACTO|nr:hypothetical protein [Arcanobacterium pinnipediorum]USR80083.1 hypothetical protein NG665_03675 [Arcanobacterium pinnipediorum]